jgi:hypothetical protein
VRQLKEISNTLETHDYNLTGIIFYLGRKFKLKKYGVEQRVHDNLICEKDLFKEAKECKMIIHVK